MRTTTLPRRRLALALALASAALCLAAPGAHAFEPICRPDDDAGNLPRNAAAMQESICKTLKLDTCDEGMEYVRGRQLGEHAFLTHTAMRWAGIPDTFIDDRAAFRYFAETRNAPYSSFGSYEPARPGAMNQPINVTGTSVPGTQVPRPITIPEFAEISDASYSLSDWVMGNEHCPILRDLESSASDLDACHSFASHSGIVNSLHFGVQNHETYKIYHALAQKTMDRCKQLDTVFTAARARLSPHPLERRMETTVDACEREALVFEAIASHFMADAWSSGHMWQRWGSPIYPAPQEVLRHHVVSVVSGLIHGWRAVIARSKFADPLVDEHDPLNMPGPADLNDLTGPWSPAEVGASETVQWTYPLVALQNADVARDPVPGAGDLYLMQCLARDKNDPRWALYQDGLTQPTSPLFRQRRRMLSCMAASFEEIYRGSSHPASLRPLIPAADRDPAVTSASATACWEARATNQSMLLAGKLSHARGSNIFEPATVANFVVGGAEFFAGPLQNFVPASRADLDRQQDRLRDQLIVLAAEAKIRAAEDPRGTDLADLEGPFSSLLGVPRSSAAKDIISQGQVPYLERKDFVGWSADHGDTCTSDRSCRDRNQGRGYCDRYGAHKASGGGFEARCADHELPVLRAFRDAEVPFWCNGDSWQDFEAAREACKGKPANHPACVSCVQVIGPRLRNGCDTTSSYMPLPTAMEDNRSLCDIVRDNTGSPALPLIPNLGGRVYWPYKRMGSEDWPTATRRAALEACQNGKDYSDGITGVLDFGYDAAPPATADILRAGANAGRGAGTCGKLEGMVHWYHFAIEGPYTYFINLRPRATNSLGKQAAIKLELALFDNCNTAAPPSAIAASADDDSDGTTDRLYLQKSGNTTGLVDFCLRISPTSISTRTAWELEMDGPLP